MRWACTTTMRTATSAASSWSCSELHGWSPKYHTPDLKHDIARRLKDRILFGGDYPLFSYERLVNDWKAEGYKPEILEKVFHANAARFFESIGLEL